MPDDDARKLRQEAADLLAKAADASDQAERRKLASRAFALAQSAEVAERSRQETQQQPSVDTDLQKNLKLVAENNLTRFLGCLCVETDTAQRETYRGLLLREEQWFGMREERLEILQRLIRDCDGRVQRHKALLDGQRTAGLDVRHTETLMSNLLETQALLLDSLKNELRHG